MGQKIFRSEECPYCYSRIRVCKMCQFYDASYYNSCREDEAERVIDKEKVNYCDYFSLAGDSPKKRESNNHAAEAHALFKDS